MPKIYIGVGSNLGSREENCRKAIELFSQHGIRVVKSSSMIETEPWGVEKQPKFINMVVEAETVLVPEELLKALEKIESDLGRRPAERWSPRIIDLDVLFYDDLVMKTTDLEIPHPGIKDRDFVLKPLVEIAPDVMHPVLKKSVSELLNEMNN